MCVQSIVRFWIHDVFITRVADSVEIPYISCRHLSFLCFYTIFGCSVLLHLPYFFRVFSSLVDYSFSLFLSCHMNMPITFSVAFFHTFLGAVLGFQHTFENDRSPPYRPQLVLLHRSLVEVESITRNEFSVGNFLDEYLSKRGF